MSQMRPMLGSNKPAYYCKQANRHMPSIFDIIEHCYYFNSRTFGFMMSSYYIQTEYKTTRTKGKLFVNSIASDS